MFLVETRDQLARLDVRADQLRTETNGIDDAVK